MRGGCLPFRDESISKSVVLRMFVNLINVNRYVKKNIKVENLFA